MSNCHRRLAKTSEKPSDGASVQLLSKISRAPVTDSAAEPVEKQKKPTLDPRFEQHCSPAQLVRPDTSVKQVRLLRDTGALQYLVCSRVLTNHDYKLTGEFRLIRGITAECRVLCLMLRERKAVDYDCVPLVQVVEHVQCLGKVECCY